MKKFLLLSAVLLASTSDLALAGGLEWLEKANEKDGYLIHTGQFGSMGVYVPFYREIEHGYTRSKAGVITTLDGALSNLNNGIEDLQRRVRALEHPVKPVVAESVSE
jgi:hypothetical protein